MAKKIINNLSERGLACDIPKMAQELPHKFINSALPKACEAIKDFICASVRLAKIRRNENGEE